MRPFFIYNTLGISFVITNYRKGVFFAIFRTKYAPPRTTAAMQNAKIIINTAFQLRSSAILPSP